MKFSQIKYERFTVEDMRLLTETAVKNIQSAKSAQELVAARKQYLDALGRKKDMASIAYIRFTLDTRDEFYRAEADYYDEANPQNVLLFTDFIRAFLASSYIDGAAKLLNPKIIAEYKNALRLKSPVTVPFDTEINKAVTRYTKLMSSIIIEFDGKRLTCEEMNKYLKDPDRSIRRAAYEQYGKVLEGYAEEIDGIYDFLIKERNKLARAMGFKDYTEYGDLVLNRLDYSNADIEAFRNSVKEDIVPVVTRYKNALAKKLGYDSFMLYDNDNYFIEGDPRPQDGLMQAAQEAYNELSSVTGSFFKTLTDSQAFDTLAREGKSGGGYCMMFDSIPVPFIFANFNGTNDDVEVITHEFGHALAAYLSNKNGVDPEINVGNAETAEIHSMSMEFFAAKFLERFYGAKAKKAEYKHLMDALSFIPYGTIVDYFQRLCYKNENMTAGERRGLWNKLEGEFRPWLTTKGMYHFESGIRWHYQRHIFENPLYYIDYCLAQSVALQFKAYSLRDYNAAFSGYLELCTKGGTKYFADLVKDAGLISPFERGALKEIVKSADIIIKELDV